jgi:hypothetical protein
MKKLLLVLLFICNSACFGSTVHDELVAASGEILNFVESFDTKGKLFLGFQENLKGSDKDISIIATYECKRYTLSIALLLAHIGSDFDNKSTDLTSLKLAYDLLIEQAGDDAQMTAELITLSENNGMINALTDYHKTLVQFRTLLTKTKPD